MVDIQGGYLGVFPKKYGKLGIKVDENVKIWKLCPQKSKKMVTVVHEN